MGLNFIAEILQKRNPTYTKEEILPILKELSLFLSELSKEELREVIKVLAKQR